MSTRLKLNKNERQYLEDTYKGLPVIDYRGPLVERYLEKTFRTLESALSDYPRIFATRFDLMLPSGTSNWPSTVISRFIDNLKYEVNAFLKERGIPRDKCLPRFVWSKERNTSLNNHYHFLLILNKDVFFTSGRVESDNLNLVSRIQISWSKALGLDFSNGYPLVHFPRNRDYRVDRNSADFLPNLSMLFSRASYLAKEESKLYQDGTRHFGCSHSSSRSNSYSLQADIADSRRVITEAVASGEVNIGEL